MRKLSLLLVVVALLACPLLMQAQTASGGGHQMQGPPKVLEIFREDAKPGKAIAHRKHEAAWTQAFIKAGYPYSLAISSVTGPDEDWFITPFDSFADIEKLNAKMETAAFQQIMETYSPKETDFLTESRAITAKYRADLSYQPDFKVGEYKYFNVLIVRYKLGSGPEDVHKIVAAAREKTHPEYHQVVYQVNSGMPVGTYLYFTPVKSMAEWDQPPDKAYGEAIKEGGFDAAVAKDVQFVDTRLFAFNPKLSYVSADVAKANPSFWNPKPAMAKTAASGEKPAAPAAKKEADTKKK
ncbi:MAG: hypothetical protein ACR2IF_10740 [Terriglobales bacterium]